MGQQQLLLIVLGIIIVGIAVAVGINMFRSSAVDANRNAIVSDLAHLASKAQQHLKKPTSMGGGAQSFNGFHLNQLDKLNDNGAYKVLNAAPTAAPATWPDTAGGYLPTTADTTIYIQGQGTEVGDDRTTHVFAYSTVTDTNFVTVVLN